MLRYVKHLSAEELQVKIDKLGFQHERVREFVGRAGDIVLVDTYPSKIEQVNLLLSGTSVNSFYEDGKLLVSFDSEEQVRTLIKGAEVAGLREYLECAQRVVTYIRKRHPYVMARGRKIELGVRPPLIMGILNVTPDSFFDGGKYFDRKGALIRAREMISEGANIIDVGGESTRPGADPVSEHEELKRVVPIIEELASTTDALISVDTYKASVAREALEAGAHIVNDISGFRYDHDMAEVAAIFGAAVIIMHIKGNPKDMQKNPSYDSLSDEILDYFQEGIEIGIRYGIRDENIIIDPGMGFGKRYEDNIYILKNLEEFRSAGYPVIVGPSQKEFIGHATGRKAGERIYGTAAAVSLAVYNGADIVRVHNVKEMRDAVLMSWEIKKGQACESSSAI